VRKYVRGKNVGTVKYCEYYGYIKVTTNGKRKKCIKTSVFDHNSRRDQFGIIIIQHSYDGHRLSYFSRQRVSKYNNIGVVLYFHLSSQKVGLLIFCMHHTKVDQSYSYESNIPFVTPLAHYVRTTTLHYNSDSYLQLQHPNMYEESEEFVLVTVGCRGACTV